MYAGIRNCSIYKKHESCHEQHLFLWSRKRYFDHKSQNRRNHFDELDDMPACMWFKVREFLAKTGFRSVFSTYN